MELLKKIVCKQQQKREWTENQQVGTINVILLRCRHKAA